MPRLGYERYGAQGGDWGSVISRQLRLLAPDHVVGVHLNLLMPPREQDLGMALGQADLSDAERERLAALARFRQEGSGHSRIQATRPQTLSYALTDSPWGQLAWIAEKFWEWSDPATRPAPDDVLTNVTIYWVTRTAGSSARLFYEIARTASPDPPPYLGVPVGVAVFPHEMGAPIRRFAERENRIVHWSEFDRGGHFAALEVPDLLVADIRAFFRRVGRPAAVPQVPWAVRPLA